MVLTPAEISRRYYYRHREKRLQAARDYRKKHKLWLSEKTKAIQRAWRKAHPEKVRAIWSRYSPHRKPRNKTNTKPVPRKRSTETIKAVADRFSMWRLKSRESGKV
jgi:hypothetical protein